MKASARDRSLLSLAAAKPRREVVDLTAEDSAAGVAGLIDVSMNDAERLGQRTELPSCPTRLNRRGPPPAAVSIPTQSRHGGADHPVGPWSRGSEPTGAIATAWH
ncbi:hypothetical protein A5791_03735 [Mycobacterium sp. 852002-51163_SCH5372311]|nr:hypothetical protein A5791_03735 [Mycobacterium sp. 852002-51163_SCH5372311]